MLVLLGAREAGCLREVAALCSDRYRQVPVYYAFLTMDLLKLQYAVSALKTIAHSSAWLIFEMHSLCVS